MKIWSNQIVIIPFKRWKYHWTPYFTLWFIVNFFVCQNNDGRAKHPNEYYHFNFYSIFTMRKQMWKANWRCNSKLSLFSLTVKILKVTLCLLILTTLKRKRPYTSKSFPYHLNLFSHNPLKIFYFPISRTQTTSNLRKYQPIIALHTVSMNNQIPLINYLQMLHPLNRQLNT